MQNPESPREPLGELNGAIKKEELEHKEHNEQDGESPTIGELLRLLAQPGLPEEIKEDLRKRLHQVVELAHGAELAEQKPRRRRAPSPVKEEPEEGAQELGVVFLPPTPEPDELDTKIVTKRLAEKLERLRITQTKFSNKVLSRRQSTLSDMIRIPRPWSQMNGGGKGPYLRMHAFLKLTDEQMLEVVEMKPVDAQRAIGFEVAATLKKREKAKSRTQFTEVQKRTLEVVFKSTSTPKAELTKSLGEYLGVPVTCVRQYFQNKRKRTCN